ncbi:MAG: hypothetical protein P1V97_32655 [Planctomycetota bacterium]|nr:hypothetical protein [Planctomycetota bacterium]
MAEPKRQYSVPIVERRAAIFLLISLAMVDGKVEEREIELLSKAAARFGSQLKRSHLKRFDIIKCIETIQSPSLQQMLMFELIELGQIDGLWDDQEKAIVVRACKHWKLELPNIPGANWDQVPELGDDLTERASSGLLDNPELREKIMKSDLALEFSYFRVVKHGDTLLVGSPLGQKWRNAIGFTIILAPVFLSLTCGLSHVFSSQGWLAGFAMLTVVIIIFVPGIFAFGSNLRDLTRTLDMEITKGPGGTLRIRRDTDDDSKQAIEVIEDIVSIQSPLKMTEERGGLELIEYDMIATLKDGSEVPIMKSGSDAVSVDYLAETMLRHMNGEDGWSYLKAKLSGNSIKLLFALAISLILVIGGLYALIKLISGEAIIK